MAKQKKNETRKATLFDLLSGVTNKKVPWDNWSVEDKKSFSPYMINRWLSMRQELVEFVNELQQYTIGVLQPREVYKLYYELLPKQSSFAKYIKGKKSSKFTDKLVDLIAKHFQLSKLEAETYAELMSKSDCECLLQMYGTPKKEIRTALKGKK